MFQVGDPVFFRPKSAKERGQRGTVVKPQDEVELEKPAAKGAKDDHVWVQFSSSSSTPQQPCKWVSIKRLVPIYSSKHEYSTKQFEPPQITKSVMLTPETIHYRHLACSQVSETDHVLEIGCSTGETSAILLRYGRSWVGFDTSADMIKQCRSRLDALEDKFAFGPPPTTKEKAKQCKAVKMDALKDPKGALHHARKFTSNAADPDVVFLDIGGNREEEGVIEMMAWALNSFPSLRLLVVKSRNAVQDMTSGAAQLENGVIETGSTWFQTKIECSHRVHFPRHPMQAPLVYSPANSTQPICRYHNYHSNGCSKGSACPFDHEHCHNCSRPQHTARECVELRS